MLLREQSDISAQRAMPIENTSQSSKVISESAEVVPLYYYNSGVITADAGQAAGVNVVGKFAYSEIMDLIGSKVANFGNSSLAFTCLAFTTEKEFPYNKLEQSLNTNGTTLLDIICSDFSNGDYCVDYRTGTIYGKKATTATSLTAVSYKRPSQLGLLDKASVDATGALKVTGGASSVSAQYISPADFVATYTSASTITLSGLPFTIATGTQVVYIKVRNSSTNITTTYVAGANGYGFGHSAGVVTAYLNGVAASIFTANDMYEVGLNSQEKAYDATLDVRKTIDQSPDRNSYLQDSLLDATNIAAATNYYPSALGMSMDGLKDASLSGKFIDADGTMTMTIEATQDEDSVNADWVQVYAYDVKNNAMANSWAVTNGTLTFFIDLDNLNANLFRIKMVNSGATNTGIIKLRRKSL